MATRKPKIIIGWEEWCSFPDLNLPAVKAKIDTGAKTSALHAYDIKAFTKEGVKYVRFKIHPLQKNNDLFVECVALLADYRVVMSSNGEREKRYVIKTRLLMGTKKAEIEITLTSRHNMAFRMLMGREALRKTRFVVDPVKSYQLGKIKGARTLYSDGSLEK